jgi:hypothetical protein
MALSFSTISLNLNVFCCKREYLVVSKSNTARLTYIAIVEMSQTRCIAAGTQRKRSTCTIPCFTRSMGQCLIRGNIALIRWLSWW